MGQAVALWLKTARRKRTVPLKDALEEMREAWEKEAARPNSSVRGMFPFDRPIQLGAYLRKHAGEYVAGTAARWKRDEAACDSRVDSSGRSTSASALNGDSACGK
jgi:hypothetical protein